MGRVKWRAEESARARRASASLAGSFTHVFAQRLELVLLQELAPPDLLDPLVQVDDAHGGEWWPWAARQRGARARRGEEELRGEVCIEWSDANRRTARERGPASAVRARALGACARACVFCGARARLERRTGREEEQTSKCVRLGAAFLVGETAQTVAVVTLTVVVVVVLTIGVGFGGVSACGCV